MRSVLHVLPHPGAGGETVVDLLVQLDGFEHRRCHLANARAPFRAAPSLALGLRRVRREAAEVDLIHVLGDTCAVLCAPLFARQPSIWNTQGLHLVRRAKGPVSSLVTRRIQIAMAEAKFTTCSSASELSDLAAIAPGQAQKLIELPNGVPLPPLRSMAEQRSVRRSLGLEPDAIIALYLGELEPRKRPLDAVRATNAAASRDPRVLLMVAGNGPQAREVAREGGPAVHVLGYQRDPGPLFTASDLFLMPSEREGLSLALLEAMAHGLAIVASNGPGNPDGVGDAGILHPVGDIDAITTALLNLSGDEQARLRLGSAARRRVEERFTVDRFLADSKRAFVTALT